MPIYLTARQAYLLELACKRFAGDAAARAAKEWGAGMDGHERMQKEYEALEKKIMRDHQRTPRQWRR